MVRERESLVLNLRKKPVADLFLSEVLMWTVIISSSTGESLSSEIECAMMEDGEPKISIGVSLINANNEMTVTLLNNTESFSEFSFFLASDVQGNELQTEFEIDLTSNEFGYSLSTNETSGRGPDKVSL